MPSAREYRIVERECKDIISKFTEKKKCKYFHQTFSLLSLQIWVTFLFKFFLGFFYIQTSTETLKKVKRITDPTVVGKPLRARPITYTHLDSRMRANNSESVQDLILRLYI